MQSCTFEIYVDGAWRVAATLDVKRPELGHAGASRLNYDDLYALDHFGATDARALSVRYPATLELYLETTWPAFVLDILPQGAGRAALLATLEQTDGQERDWPLLLAGSGNPPGNVRVREAVRTGLVAHGFTRRQVATRDADFIEHMYQAGAVVGGTSGVQGESPKFLLNEADDGLFYVDAALADERVRQHWLVKYPRTTRRETDVTIVRNEACYHAVATRLGLATHGRVTLDGDALFIPRFDRACTSRGVERRGQESLAAVAGIAAFGRYPQHQALVEGLARHVTSPAMAVAEYVARDAVGLALGNTDNHYRNTALTKTEDGTVSIAPLFDFAPMFLEQDGLPRVTRWGESLERGHSVDWGGVIATLPLDAEGRDSVCERLRALREAMREMPNLLRAEGVDAYVIERRAVAIDTVAKDLGKL